MTAPNLAFAIGLPPEEAIKYFESKGLKVTDGYREMWQESHAKAFTVAHLSKLDVLNDIHAALQYALRKGTTEDNFVKFLTPILQEKGWWGQAIDKATGEVLEAYDNTGRPVEYGSPRRLKLIYRQNMQTAYMAGRYTRQMELAQSGARPYWQYLAVRDSRTRPSHGALHGRVWPADDPIWNSLYPPNGWNCRCRVRALSEARLKAEGLTVESSEGLLVNMQVSAGKLPDGTPDLRDVTGIRYIDRNGQPAVMLPDAGWSYNPGKAGLAHLGELYLGRSAQMPAMIGSIAAGEALSNVSMMSAVMTAYQAMAQAVFTNMDRRQYTPQNQLLHLGTLDTSAILAMERAGFAPASGLLSMRDNDLMHMVRDDKVLPIARDWLMDLPMHLQTPKAVLLDTTHKQPSVLLVFDHADDARHKIVVQVDYTVKARNVDGKKETIKANIINTGRIVDVNDLNTYKIISGAL